MEIHDRLSPGQVFLSSLRQHVRPGTALYTSFTPSYSERFFLQVVDGFTLEETPVDGTSYAGALVLVKSSDPGHWTRGWLPGAVVLARQEDYVLVRLPG